MCGAVTGSGNLVVSRAETRYGKSFSGASLCLTYNRSRHGRLYSAHHAHKHSSHLVVCVFVGEVLDQELGKVPLLRQQLAVRTALRYRTILVNRFDRTVHPRVSSGIPFIHLYTDILQRIMPDYAVKTAQNTGIPGCNFLFNRLYRY